MPRWLRRKVSNAPKHLQIFRVFRHAIEIHSANFAGDILLGWKSQLHGCCAPGKEIGELDRGDGVMQRAVLQSRQALEEFMTATNGEDLEIEVLA